MWTVKKYFVLAVAISLTACGGSSGGDGGDGSSGGKAPNSIANRTYRHVIQSATGTLVPSTGSFTVAVNSSNGYTLTGSIGNSNGTLTYVPNGSRATVRLSDSALGRVECIYTFNDNISGSYKCTYASEAGASQTGTFRQNTLGRS